MHPAVAATSPAAGGARVTLEVERGDETRQVEVEVGEVSQLGRPAIGAAVRTLGLEVAVGGITQKVAAARRGGAEIFLVPEDEAEMAEQEAAGRLRVEPVASLEEAISLLQG